MWLRKPEAEVLIESTNTDAESKVIHAWGLERVMTFVGLTSTGAGSAEARIYVSQYIDSPQGQNPWELLVNVALSFTDTPVVESVRFEGPWKYLKVEVDNLDGTDSEVTVIFSAF